MKTATESRRQAANTLSRMTATAIDHLHEGEPHPHLAEIEAYLERSLDDGPQRFKMACQSYSPSVLRQVLARLGHEDLPEHFGRLELSAALRGASIKRRTEADAGAPAYGPRTLAVSAAKCPLTC